MPQNLLYLDPWSGLSGDMILAALVDLGGQAAETAIGDAVESLGLEGVAVEILRDTEWGLRCVRVNVRAEELPPLRRLPEMVEVIQRAGVSERVKEQAVAAVVRLAEVEAGVHGCSADEIHFHEVGAADTLVDILGTFVLVETLQVDEVFVGIIPLGGGTVEIAHGRMGVPAPATAALLRGYQAVGGPEMRELTTPTGALLISQLAARQGPLPSMTLKAAGYGAGAMKLETGPNVLRAVLGEAVEAVGGSTAPGRRGSLQTVVELRTNVDDASPEVIGYTLRRLRDAGALDAWTVTGAMKKDRPGVILYALVQPDQEAKAVDIVFHETGTLGVRRAVLERYVAERGMVWVKVADQSVGVKWGRYGGRVASIAPEYEDAAAAALATGLPLQEVMRQAQAAARALLAQGGQT